MDTNLLSRMARLSDHDLLARVKDLAQREREATVALIAHLAELDERRLYLGEGYSSLFKYCTDVLHLSEHATCNRIEVARAVRRFPVLLEHLAAGLVSLSTVRLLAPHLTPENHGDVLALARHKSKREVDGLVARLRPQPPVQDVIRKLSTRTTSASEKPLLVGSQDAPSAPQDGNTHEIMSTVAPCEMLAPVMTPAPSPRRAVVSPLAPERYKVQFTASAEMHAKLREAQALSRHQIPDGDLEKIFDRALDALLRSLRKQKLAATERPRVSGEAGLGSASGAAPSSAAGSRHIPAAVKRAVWTRDGGRCAFVSANGRRCTEEGFLEFHHVVPYASGGRPSVDNIELRCRAHNGYEAECHFGRRVTAVREEPAVYTLSAAAVSVAAVPGDRSINSFRNEFARGYHGEWPSSRGSV
ncbi:MAG: HNH endonuclease [Armatimonadota bacterium]